MTDTIFALSSGAPPAAIAIVRASGPAAGSVARAFGFQLPRPRQASLRVLRDADGIVLDRALVLLFPAATSVTGEVVVELHLHGGRALVRRVLDVLGSSEGFRAAEPGEFTRRAVLNGRLDLLDAEALGDLLAAETESQRRHAADAAGTLRTAVSRWQTALLGPAAAVEAALDHEDDGGLTPDWAVPLSATLREIEAALGALPAERIRDGMRVLIAGPPNAGKSTLLNAIAGRAAAITSDRPGTTRDMIEVPLAIEGIAIRLTDSPGLRDAADTIEAIGIERAQKALAEADLVLWLGMGAAPEAARSAIRVAAKSDLGAGEDGADVSVSALTGAGVGTLLALIATRLRARFPCEGEAVLNDRHRAAVEEVRHALAGAIDKSDLVVRAEHLRAARQALGRVTGSDIHSDLLDAIFAGFCLGK